MYKSERVNQWNSLPPHAIAIGMRMGLVLSLMGTSQISAAETIREPLKDAPARVIVTPSVRLPVKLKNILLTESFHSVPQLQQAVHQFYGGTITRSPSEWQYGCVRDKTKQEKLFVVAAESRHLYLVCYKTASFGVCTSWDLFEKNPKLRHVAGEQILCDWSCPSSARALVVAVRKRCTEPHVTTLK